MREIDAFWDNMRKKKEGEKEIKEEGTKEIGMVNYCTPRAQPRIDNFSALISKV